MAKISIERVIIKNRAPFENLDMAFNENEITVLTAINGRGKTTILSYIVDAWHEIAKRHFFNTFKGIEDKYYRVSSSIFNIVRNEPSFVYIRFKLLTEIKKEEYRATNENYISKDKNGQTFFYKKDNLDYVDIRNNCTQQQYDTVIPLEDRILFNLFQEDLKQSQNIKYVSNFDKEKVKNLFNSNVITYFPAYRYETPGYLNDPYKIHLDFTKEMSYAGYLPNPLEVITGLPQLANWIMDVVLDMEIYKQTQNVQLADGHTEIFDVTPEKIILWNSITSIISQTLISKKHEGDLRFGIGKRNSGSTRISIMSDKVINGLKVSKQIYPTIFNLSSGEAAMLCMFGEILRQADKNKNNIHLQQITGIILIDEIDKHLHIKLQKEVLPLLLNLFPNVQFIVSSHSPFLNMGLAEKSPHRAKIIDLDNEGISADPTTNDRYKEVYEMMIRENNRFAEKYNTLLDTIKNNTKPLIITEGKTDIVHLKNAKEQLRITNCDVEFYNIPDKWGDSELKKILENISKIQINRKIIGIFDRDVPAIVSEIEKDGQLYKKYSDNVYAFCLPVPNGREYYTNISIEFYYSDDEIKKEKDGRRLYFDNEVENLFNKTKNKPVYQKLENPDTDKESSKKIFDEDKMCKVTDWIHSKANFANLVATDSEFSIDFNYSNFILIFDKIKEIINNNNDNQQY